jgi:hypothetical protein
MKKLLIVTGIAIFIYCNVFGQLDTKPVKARLLMEF